MAANDASYGNVLQNDTIATYGSECMDVKENAHDNVLQDSLCLDNAEPASDYSSFEGLDRPGRAHRLPHGNPYQ